MAYCSAYSWDSKKAALRDFSKVDKKAASMVGMSVILRAALKADQMAASKAVSKAVKTAVDWEAHLVSPKAVQLVN